MGLFNSLKKPKRTPGAIPSSIADEVYGATHLEDGVDVNNQEGIPDVIAESITPNDDMSAALSPANESVQELNRAGELGSNGLNSIPSSASYQVTDGKDMQDSWGNHEQKPAVSDPKPLDEVSSVVQEAVFSSTPSAQGQTALEKTENNLLTAEVTNSNTAATSITDKVAGKETIEELPTNGEQTIGFSPEPEQASEVSREQVTPGKEPIYEEVSYVKQTPIKTIYDKEPLERTIETTKIISIINQKGGVGKSTTAINLAAALGEQGLAVLVIDLDPQGNTTSGLGVDKGQVSSDVYDLLLNDASAENAIVADVCKGMDLIPATINLAGAEVELVNEIARENRLKTAIQALRGKYDYIFIDCPPALGLLTVNALVASDSLLIPIQCEFYALEGVTKLLDSMKRVKNALNPDLDIFGVLLTMYDGRTMLSKQVAAEVRNFFNELVFETVIPRTVRLSEAPSFGQPITEYDPSGRGGKAYISLAKEVIQRG